MTPGEPDLLVALLPLARGSVILVDNIRRHPSGWCHMVNDRSVEELHAFAAEIGLRLE